MKKLLPLLFAALLAAPAAAQTISPIGGDPQSLICPAGVYTLNAFVKFGDTAGTTCANSLTTESSAGTVTLAPTANNSALTLTSYSLTGANAQSAIDIAGTWNTSGTPTALKVNITDTASNATSLLADFQVDGATVVRITKDGFVRFGINGTVGYDTSNTKMTVRADQDNTLSLQTGGAITFGTRQAAGNTLYGQFSSVGLSIGASGAASILISDAANTLAQRNGTNAQAFRVYNTYTDASNNEFGALIWSTNELFVGATFSGTGSARPTTIFASGGSPVNIQTGGTRRWRVDQNGMFLAVADNTYDIGASGATRPRTIYAAGDVFADWIRTGSGQGRLRSSGSGGINLHIANGANSDFGLLQLGGTTSSFPAIKRNATGVDIRLADDSAYAPIAASAYSAGATAGVSCSGAPTAGFTSVNGIVTAC